MKRIFVIILICLCVQVKSQDVQVLFGENNKIFFENTHINKNSTTFAYLELACDKNAMMKVFHEQKYWEMPLYIHVEYQNSNNNHTGLLGTSYTLNHKKGYISLGALFRYDRECSFQISNSYLLFWEWGDFNGYNHLWINKHCFFVGQERFNIKINQNLAFSIILDITYFSEWNITPYTGLRYRF